MQAFGQFSNQAQNTSALGQVAGSQPAPPPTLTRALSSLDELNKRLAQLTSGIQAIAQSVGGPFPIRGDNAQSGGPASPPSAMESLNSRIDAAHAYASDIEHAQEAIRRSLGG